MKKEADQAGFKGTRTGPLAPECILTGQLRLHRYLGVSEAGFRAQQEAPE